MSKNYASKLSGPQVFQILPTGFGKKSKFSIIATACTERLVTLWKLERDCVLVVSSLVSIMIACVAADSFPFSGRAEIEQANEKWASGGARLGNAGEHAWGEPKNWGEVGREWVRRGRGSSVASPPPPTAYFATLSQFSSRSRAFGKGKETAATQATIMKDQVNWRVNSFMPLTTPLQSHRFQAALQQ